MSNQIETETERMEETCTEVMVRYYGGKITATWYAAKSLPEPWYIVRIGNVSIDINQSDMDGFIEKLTMSIADAKKREDIPRIDENDGQPDEEKEWYDFDPDA